jgi:hypothetical protein
MNIQIDQFDHPRALATVLFGSRARGDADRLSDTDIAIFVEADGAEELREVKAEFEAGSHNSNTTLSLYSRGTAEYMACEGSLFLWHLKLEGKIINDRHKWLSNLLQDLPAYGNAQASRDLKTFSQVLSDCSYALSNQLNTLEFEMATMFAVLRNVAIIYCFKNGTPCFGRTSPITKLAHDTGAGFPFSSEQILCLERMRLAYVRNPEPALPHMSGSAVLDTLQGVLLVLKFVKGDAHA